MQLITHTQHLDAIPPSPIKTHIQSRFDQLSEDTDVPPNIILVEATDDITGPDYAFIEARGLLSRHYSKWTRKCTNVLDLRVFLDTSKYTSDSNRSTKPAFDKHLCTDGDR